MSDADYDITSRVAELDAILDNNIVDEVGITLDTSLPPIFYIDGKLGIAKTVLKPLFKFALQSVYKFKFSTRVTACEHVSKHALSITRLVLLIKGDFPIAFDIRKQLIEVGALPIRDEIAFTSLLYTRHPKCPSGWHHRRWCLLRSTRTDLKLTAMEVETERELTRVMAEKHSKNYYAWMHRLWVLQYMSKYQLEDELYFTKTWLQGHVSDHSAVNHRIQVIKRILEQVECLACIVHGENDETTNGMDDWVVFSERMFRESEELIWSRPGHEALWYLRRSLLEILLTQLQKSLSPGMLLCVLGNAIISAEEVGQLTLVTSTSIETSAAAVELDPPSDATTKNSFALLSTYLTQQRTGSVDVMDQLVSWLLALLHYEKRFAQRCVDHTAAWDYQAQRAMATRYAAFVLDRVLLYTTDCTDIKSRIRGSCDNDGGTVDGGDAHGTSGQSVALRKVLSLSAKQIFHSLQSEGMLRFFSSYRSYVINFYFCVHRYVHSNLGVQGEDLRGYSEVALLHPL